MPRFCRVKGSQFTNNEYVAKIYERICEQIIPYLGIDPGNDPKSWFITPYEMINVFLNPHSFWFQTLVLLLCICISFMLGVYVRRRTIISLLQQKEEWLDKEKMLLNQLWAALEEKLENKSLLSNSRSELDKIKVELDGERSEKESIQNRISSLQRNMKLLQSERDVLEDKMKDTISTFSGMKNSINKNGQCENSNVSVCMNKINEMENLMQKLISAHHEEHRNFVSMLENKSTC